jgi:2'-5' RNA ligase
MTDPVGGHYDEEADGRYIVFLKEPEMTTDDFYRIYGPGPPVSDEGAILLDDTLTAAAGVDHRTGEVHAGAMIALIPCAEDAERLVLDGGEPLDQLHMTLVYLGDAADIPSDARLRLLDAIGRISREQIEITGNAFSINVFSPTGEFAEPCIVVGLGGDDLEGINDVAVEAADDAGIDTSLSKRPWIPHITLTYLEDDDVEALSHLDVLGYAGQRMGEVLFDRIRVAFGGEIHDFSLTSLT